MARLGTASAVSSWVEVRVGMPTREVEVPFEDWTIDGVPLRTLLGGPGVVEHTTDLRADQPAAAVESVRRLLGEAPADAAGGRVSLLVCEICGDLACGAYTCRLLIDDSVVAWQDIGWQDGVTGDLDVAPLISARFDRREYEDLLRSVAARFAPLGRPG